MRDGATETTARQRLADVRRMLVERGDRARVGTLDRLVRLPRHDLVRLALAAGVTEADTLADVALQAALAERLAGQPG